MNLFLSNSSFSFILSIIKKNPLYAPHIIKFQDAPCQNPVARKTIAKFINVLNFPFLFPPSGIYKYSLNQVDNEMCHLLQNSVID